MSLVKSHGHWLLFDDDHVEAIPDAWVERTFGSPAQFSKITDRGYILFYEKSSSRDVQGSGGGDVASPSKASETVRDDMETLHSVNRVPHKAAGTFESPATRSAAMPVVESTARYSSEDSHLATSTAMSVDHDHSAKRNRSTGGLTATLKSLFNGTTRQATHESDITRSDDYSLSSHSKTNPIQSNGM